MSKYKICPLCGEQNNPISMECSECAADLMNVPITDSDMRPHIEPEKKRPEGIDENRNNTTPASGQENINAGKMARLCSSCGSINPPQLRKCQNCGEDISDILPMPIPTLGASNAPEINHTESSQGELHYQLSEINSGYVYNVPCGVMLIGREEGMRECLASRPYVSRIHAKLIAMDGRLMIENLSTTNYTYVNNNKISAGRIELHPGDELGLGGVCVNGVRQDKAAYFLVGLMS